jgi:hypothetical protein
MEPIAALMNNEGAILFDQSRVIMSMSEYEERFLPPTPSVYQTLNPASGSNRARRYRRSFWVGAALVGVMTMTGKAVLHHPVHSKTSHVSQVWEPRIR